MPENIKISIEEFGNKIEEEKAILTHYLHNYHNGVSAHYEICAMQSLENYLRYRNEERTIIVKEDALQQLLIEVENVPFPTPEDYTFKFIDLFAGIGGFRVAMQNVGGKCVYTSEWNKDAQETNTFRV